MRVIAGIAKGAHIDVPKGRDVRPTADRVREALFSSLSARVQGARVLDLFGGSGALAIEALSRGAAFAVIVEQDKKTGDLILANLKSARVNESAKLVRGDALRAVRDLSARGERFDIVFIDPPYASDLAARALAAIVATGLLAEGAVAIVERDRRSAAPTVDGLNEIAEKRYGDTVLTYYSA